MTPKRSGGLSRRREASLRNGFPSRRSFPSSRHAILPGGSSPFRLRKISTSATFSMSRSFLRASPPACAKRLSGLASECGRAGRGRVAGRRIFPRARRSPLVNELAPRPHNSGHYTFDALRNGVSSSSNCGRFAASLGSNALLTPVVMWNLLGDLWEHGTPDWGVVLREPRAKLHIYGKAEGRPGRKMGHVAVLAEIEEALDIVEAFKKQLGDGEFLHS